MENNIKRYTKEELHKLIVRKFLLAGVLEEQAIEVANHLVFADARGIHSHGSNRVKPYVKRIQNGFVNLKPNISIEQSAPSTVIIDGDNSLGMPVASAGVKKAIEIAKDKGVAIVGVKNINHSGTMSYYLEKVAQENLVGVSVAIAPPQCAPYGGSSAYFGTNPLGFCAPVKDSDPIMVDMATSVKAFGYVMDAKNKGLDIPQGWALDADGNPTTDPSKAVLMLPIAGPKGSSLMLMINVIAGIMLNIPAGEHIKGSINQPDSIQNIGQLFIIINPANFMPIDKFLEDMKTMCEEIKNIKPAKGFDEVLLPGEIANRQYNEYLKDGIPIPLAVVNYLEDDSKL